MPFHPSVYPLCTAMANEWREMRHQLENLAASLCTDAAFAERHVESLQLFDALAQQADESAVLLDRLSGGKLFLDGLVSVWQVGGQSESFELGRGK